MSVQIHRIWNTTAFKAASSKIFQSVMQKAAYRCPAAFVHKHGTFQADVPGLGLKSFVDPAKSLPPSVKIATQEQQHGISVVRGSCAAVQSATRGVSDTQYQGVPHPAHFNGAPLPNHRSGARVPLVTLPQPPGSKALRAEPPPAGRPATSFESVHAPLELPYRATYRRRVPSRSPTHARPP
ncbi:hypothetical protein B0H10DRAFT_2211455 [Mycena sp. CBHHK59/15]|nr:hypothetical protein B0H10DRAFT_2211455 [Mycena sp. CBHHK59/15]